MGYVFSLFCHFAKIYAGNVVFQESFKQYFQIGQRIVQRDEPVILPVHKDHLCPAAQRDQEQASDIAVFYLFRLFE